MTLEEAIEHCKSVANEKCDSCSSAEHRQLAKWLEELRLYREASKTVLDEMELRNKIEEHTIKHTIKGKPEPYKCPDCIEFPCARKECDKNTLAKECKYFELW